MDRKIPTWWLGIVLVTVVFAFLVIGLLYPNKPVPPPAQAPIRPAPTEQQPTDPAPTAQTVRVGMPNPAAVYCKERGGTIEMRENDAGQYGWCHLPDGTDCDEWVLFRNKTCK